LCAVHCVVFPIVLVFVPFVEAYVHLNTAVEITMYASISILGGSFLWQDYQKHQKKYGFCFVAYRTLRSSIHYLL